MEKFISFEKMSKKEKKKINDSKRTFWSIPPTTKVIKNKRNEERKKACRRARFC